MHSLHLHDHIVSKINSILLKYKKPILCSNIVEKCEFKNDVIYIPTIIENERMLVADILKIIHDNFGDCGCVKELCKLFLYMENYDFLTTNDIDNIIKVGFTYDGENICYNNIIYADKIIHDGCLYSVPNYKDLDFKICGFTMLYGHYIKPPLCGDGTTHPHVSSCGTFCIERYLYFKEQNEQNLRTLISCMKTVTTNKMYNYYDNIKKIKKVLNI